MNEKLPDISSCFPGALDPVSVTACLYIKAFGILNPSGLSFDIFVNGIGCR